MVGLHNSEFKNPVIRWIDTRLPLFSLMNAEYGKFPTPKNFNYLWNFGALAMFMLAVMIVTGIFLAMNYDPNASHAFDSVEHIMRDVNYGWLLRYLHSNGASMFFAIVYIHTFRGMFYGSYKNPRELLWILGMVIFLLLMATAFLGYTLPWGQMSFWGATVITNLFSAIPLVGPSIVTWLWGGFSVDNPTLNRFFALHFLLPFVVAAVVFLHVWALHVTGSNNPTGIDPKGPQDTVPFHPYYTTKDCFGLTIFMIVYALFVFYAPNMLGHPDNYVEANPMVTPAHIVPEWYFLPFYAMLRSITFGVNIYIGAAAVCGAAALYLMYSRKPGALGSEFTMSAGGAGLFFLLGYLSQFAKDSGGTMITLPLENFLFVDAKLLGVCTMFGAIALLFVLPWLDGSPVRSAAYRPAYKKFLWLLVAVWILLGMAGGKSPDDLVSLFGLETPIKWVYVAQLGVLYYYAHFLVVLPWLAQREKTLPLPYSISESVLKGAKA